MMIYILNLQFLTQSGGGGGGCRFVIDFCPIAGEPLKFDSVISLKVLDI